MRSSTYGVMLSITLSKLGQLFEVIFVTDGSFDGSWCWGWHVKTGRKYRLMLSQATSAWHWTEITHSQRLMELHCHCFDLRLMLIYLITILV